jgi:hypothetical protein
MLKLNNLFIRFLRACGKPLVEIIVIIIITCFIFKYFPQRFRYVEMMMLAKSKKIGKIIYTSNVYRFIALLNAISKIIEKIMNNKIAAIIKRHNLLL